MEPLCPGVEESALAFETKFEILSRPWGREIYRALIHLQGGRLMGRHLDSLLLWGLRMHAWHPLPMSHVAQVKSTR